MVLEEKKIKKICSFYVSEYHLEIMLLPYITKKMSNEEKIAIITEKNLRETLEVVIERTNLENKKKEQIINLGWNNKLIKNIDTNSNVIIIGNEKFIDNIMVEFKEKQIECLSIIACYDYNEVMNNIQEITSKYSGMLNTLGINRI